MLIKHYVVCTNQQSLAIPGIPKTYQLEEVAISMRATALLQILAYTFVLDIV